AAQAGTQHVNEYYKLLNIEQFINAYKKILQQNKPTNEVVLEPYEQAVKSLAKVDLQKIDAAAMQLAEETN
ncbi:MAG: hypothetical protein AAF617_12720, partial [Bacteroidota bacterium]